MTPDFRILADRQDRSAIIRDRLISLRLTDEADWKSDDVELVLDDRDGAIVLPRTGAELDVALGYRETALIQMGLYFVDEVELSGPPSTLTIRGKAVDFVKGMQAQKTRAWEDMSLGDLVRTIAGEHEYEPVVARRFDSICLPHIAQTAESDLHLLLRLAREHGAVIKPMSKRLCCVEEGAARRANGGDMPVLAVTPQDVTDWRVSLTDRSRFRMVKATWHDKAQGKTFALEAGHGMPVFEITHIHDSESAARSAAESKLDKLQRGSSTLSLTLPGNAGASAERKLRLSGFRNGVDGDWVCRRVEHTLSDAGFTTRIEGEVPSPSVHPPTWLGRARGSVTRV